MRTEARSKRDLLEHAKRPHYLATTPRPITGLLPADGITTVPSAGNGGAVCRGHDRWFDFTPPDGVFTAVSVGYDRACGLRLDHTVECWGTRIER